MKLEGVRGIKVIKARLPYQLDLVIYDKDAMLLGNKIEVEFSPLFQHSSIDSLRKFLNDLQQALDKYDKDQKRIKLAHNLHIAIHENIRFKRLADIKKQVIDSRIQGLEYEELARIIDLGRMVMTIEAMITSMEEINWNTFYKQFPHPCGSTGYYTYRAFEALVREVRLE